MSVTLEDIEKKKREEENRSQSLIDHAFRVASTSKYNINYRIDAAAYLLRTLSDDQVITQISKWRLPIDKVSQLNRDIKNMEKEAEKYQKLRGAGTPGLHDPGREDYVRERRMRERLAKRRERAIARYSYDSGYQYQNQIEKDFEYGPTRDSSPRRDM